MKIYKCKHNIYNPVQRKGTKYKKVNEKNEEKREEGRKVTDLKKRTEF